jgi:hypothetical protein
MEVCWLQKLQTTIMNSKRKGIDIDRRDESTTTTIMDKRERRNYNKNLNIIKTFIQNIKSMRDTRYAKLFNTENITMLQLN